MSSSEKNKDNVTKDLNSIEQGQEEEEEKIPETPKETIKGGKKNRKTKRGMKKKNRKTKRR